LQIYLIFARIFARFCEFQEKKGRKNRLKKGSDVNEGKFVLNIDFIIPLKPDGRFGPLALGI
jgi:hypothetical protein